MQSRVMFYYVYRRTSDQVRPLLFFLCVKGPHWCYILAFFLVSPYPLASPFRLNHSFCLTPNWFIRIFWVSGIWGLVTQKVRPLPLRYMRFCKDWHVNKADESFSGENVCSGNMVAWRMGWLGLGGAIQKGFIAEVALEVDLWGGLGVLRWLRK